MYIMYAIMYEFIRTCPTEKYTLYLTFPCFSGAHTKELDYRDTFLDPAHVVEVSNTIP